MLQILQSWILFFAKKLSPDGVSLTMVGNNQMLWLYLL